MRKADAGSIKRFRELSGGLPFLSALIQRVKLGLRLRLPISAGSVRFAMHDKDTPYFRHEAFIIAARAKPEIWRLILGSALIVVTQVGLIFLLFGYLTGRYGMLVANTLFDRMSQGDTPGGMLLLLYSFLGLALGPIVAVRLIHGRPAGTLFGQDRYMTVNNFFMVLLPVLGLQLLVLPLLLSDPAIRPGLDLGSFLFYLPFALPGIMIQTGAEELAFRGYIQQQLAARFKTRWIWMGLPAAVFAYGHYLPGEFGANAGIIALWAGVFALLAADLTARTGNLGAALGFHLANNVMALLVVGLSGNLDGLTLWSLSADMTDPSVVRPMLAVDFMLMLTSWLLARLVLRV